MRRTSYTDLVQRRIATSWTTLEFVWFASQEHILLRITWRPSRRVIFPSIYFIRRPLRWISTRIVIADTIERTTKWIIYDEQQKQKNQEYMINFEKANHSASSLARDISRLECKLWVTTKQKIEMKEMIYFGMEVCIYNKRIIESRDQLWISHPEGGNCEIKMLGTCELREVSWDNII